MPGWLKVLLIIVVIGIVLFVGVIIAGAVWWSRNKDALIGKANQIVTEGREFGGRSDNQACVDESVTRYKKEPGLGNAISTGIFMRICLEESSPTPGFCSAVPGKMEFLKAGEWQAEQCRSVGLSTDSYCPQLFQGVQDFCQKGGSSRRSNENSNSNSY